MTKQISRGELLDRLRKMSKSSLVDIVAGLQSSDFLACSIASYDNRDRLKKALWARYGWDVEVLIVP